MLVLEHYNKGQLRPLTFGLINLVSQLSIFCQTRLYAYIGLHINMKLM
jgi:hypothetical protein